MLFVLDIMQVTFVTEPIVDLPTTGFKSQGMHTSKNEHGHLRRSIAGDNVLHVILLGVGGVIYIPHTLIPLKILGLDSQRVKKLALKLHAHSVHYAHKLVKTRLWSDVLLSALPTFKRIRRGLLACLPATLLILTDPPFSFLVKGRFFPSGPFSLIDVRSFLLLA